ncbi:MAG: class II SORL domain-containing protein [Candidatus Omnitrophica bacterium]|nr:class II SORL domain-containing protein [Candidatus Omnitrophota bacterium]
MAELKDLFQNADWKKEKHVPVIESPASVEKGKFFQVKLSVGKEIAHPNTTEHHIRWIVLYFQADGEKFPYEIARFEFSAHGESAAGPNTGIAYTHPEGTATFKTDKPGTLMASSFCNIHGLWQNSQRLEVK